MNVMFVLDTTESMGTTTDDSGCTVPGVSSPTRLHCALYGVQLILKELNPQDDNVGLMVFPGMSGTWKPCGTPSIEPYGTTSIVYQVNGIRSNGLCHLLGKLNDSRIWLRRSATTATVSPDVLRPLEARELFTLRRSRPPKPPSWPRVRPRRRMSSFSSATARRMKPWIVQHGDHLSEHHSLFADHCLPPRTCRAAMRPGGRKCQERDCKRNLVYAIAYDRRRRKGCLSQEHHHRSGKSAKTTVYYDGPTVTSSANSWNPCSALQSIASDDTKFYSTNSSCTTPTATQTSQVLFSKLGVTLSQPRLVLY